MATMKKPDDAPVTWGELREAVNSLALLGLVSSTAAALSANPHRDEENFRKTQARVEELGNFIVDRFVEGPDRG